MRMMAWKALQRTRHGDDSVKCVLYIVLVRLVFITKKYFLKPMLANGLCEYSLIINVEEKKVEQDDRSVHALP